MKHITIALVLCAIPAVAAAQDVHCDDCTHRVSVYHGEGGFIATAADDAEMVTFVATCDGVTRSDELMPNDDGMVSMLLTGDYACMSEGGSFRLGPIMDGGWYWLTMEDNSAVGGLVNDMILDNEPTMITGAGDGVKMMAGSGAVLLSETATGRVGILPTILPEPPAPDTVLCGPRIPAGSKTYTSQMSSSCMLGNGGAKVRIIGTDHLGREVMITSQTISRPVGSASVTLMADLWHNESGSYSTDTSGTGGAPSTASIQAGWPGKGEDNWLAATWAGTVGGNPGTAPAAAATTHGVVVTDGSGSTPAGQATITITNNTDYCPASATAPKHSLTLNVTATPGTNAVHPAVTTTGPLAAGLSAKLTIVCASASSANMGQELVPENPFPTDK